MDCVVVCDKKRKSLKHTTIGEREREREREERERRERLLVFQNAMFRVLFKP